MMSASGSALIRRVPIVGAGLGRVGLAGVAGLASVLLATVPVAAQTFKQTTLVDHVCCGAGEGRFDPNLVSAWGLGVGPGAPVWVSVTGSGSATMYDGRGSSQGFVVNVQPAPGLEFSVPTAVAFNRTHDFVVADGTGGMGPARFLVATEEGTIAAWTPAPAVGPPNTLARIVLDKSRGTDGPLYTGLTVASAPEGSRLYAADFLHARIDTFDGAYAPVAAPFRDPDLPPNFFPFNVRAIGGHVYVVYIAVETSPHLRVLVGPGQGIVDLFGVDGAFQGRLVTGGPLNFPYGIAVAPENFGALAGAVLVSNGGDGRINAFDGLSGAFLGTLADSTGVPLVSGGRRDIAFGNGSFAQPTNSLFFSATRPDGSGGAFGRVDLGCPADFDRSGRLGVADIFGYLNAWFAGPVSADFNGDNALDVRDIFDFLDAWFAGCG